MVCIECSIPFVPCEIYAYSDAVFSWKASLSSVLAMSSAEAELSLFALVLRMLPTVVNSQTSLDSYDCALLLFMKIIWVRSRLQDPEISKDAQSTLNYAGDFSITTSIGASWASKQSNAICISLILVLPLAVIPNCNKWVPWYMVKSDVCHSSLLLITELFFWSWFDFRFNSGIFLDSGILLAPGARGGLSR